MDVIIPKIQSKYITAFKNESSYDTAYPTFEEVNWSAIKPAVGPEEVPDEYRLSRRLSHMYANGTPPDYKFSSVDEYVPYDAQTEEEKTYADAHQIAHHNTEGCPANRMTPDDIRKTFFLEIVWGYSGWEWHDYERVIGTDLETEEPITEILKGGNLYKIKEIQTVPHIIDGHRLQHINDFLNSQNRVVNIEGFNTINLIAANRAFKRLSLVRTWDNVLECHFVDGYDEQDNHNHPFGYADLVTGESLLENLVEADGLFFNNKVYMYGGDFENVIPFTIPNIESIDRFYSYGAYTPNLRFKMPNLKVFTNGFKMAMFNTATVNFNNILIDGTLDNLIDLSGLAAGVSIYDTDSDISTIKLDLTDSNVPAATEINLSHFAEWAGPRENATNDIVIGSILNIDLNFNNKVDLSYAFSNILRGKNTSYDGISNIKNGGYERISINLHSKESLITSIAYALTDNTFIEANPIQSRPNADCNDDYVYYQSVFNDDIAYDFSPTQSISYYYSQFNSAKINTGFIFSNVDCLKSIDFRNTKFPVDTTDPDNPIYTIFPYVLNNSNYTYNQDNSRYQNISFEGSNLGGFAVQDFYLQLGDSYDETERDRKTETEWGDICSNCFKNMKNVDFTANHKLYIKNNIVEPLGRYVQYNLHLFDGCSSMTTTPTVYYTLDTTNADNNVYADQHLLFNGCNELVSINCENLNLIGGHLTNPETNITSKKLVYLKLGRWDCSIKIASKILDIPTFKATLDRQYRTTKMGALTVMKEIYDLLAVEYTTYEGVAMNYNEYCSNVYSSYNYIVDPSY